MGTPHPTPHTPATATPPTPLLPLSSDTTQSLPRPASLSAATTTLKPISQPTLASNPVLHVVPLQSMLTPLSVPINGTSANQWHQRHQLQLQPLQPRHRHLQDHNLPLN